MAQQQRRTRERQELQEQHGRELILSPRDVDALRAITDSPVDFIRQAAFERYLTRADTIHSGVGLFREDAQ